jgi:anti-sigma regulatory factor (Ser/Thr protein kinase)
MAEPLAAREARTWLSELASSHVDEIRRRDLELVVTEVVTKAIRHGAHGGTIELAATPKPEFLCVQVTDEGPGLVPRPGAMATDENGGLASSSSSSSRAAGVSRARTAARASGSSSTTETPRLHAVLGDGPSRMKCLAGTTTGCRRPVEVMRVGRVTQDRRP